MTNNVKERASKKMKTQERGTFFAKTKMNCTYSIMTTALPERVERKIINKDVHGQRLSLCLKADVQRLGTPSVVRAKRQTHHQ